MSYSLYTQGDVAKAMRRQETAAAARGTCVMGKDGARTLQVDAVLYHNARIQNERVYGVRDCWTEPEFVSDMARRHPELRVKVLPNGVRVRVGPMAPAGTTAKLTRFGRVTFRRVYG